MSDPLIQLGPSLRLRIFLGTSVALTLVVLLGSLAVWLAARAILERNLNDALRERAHALSARFAPRGPPHPLLNGRPGAPERRGEGRGDDIRPGAPERRGEGRNDNRIDERKPPQNQGNVPPELRQGDGAFFIQIIDEEKNEIARSSSLPDDDSLASLFPSHASSLSGDRIAVVHLHDGRPVRVIAERLPAGPFSLPPWLSTAPTTTFTSGTHTLFVGIDAAPVTNDLERLALALAALWIVTSALGIGVAVWLQRTVLIPVARISHDIGELGPDELHARLSTIHVPREMQIIPQRLNDLISRLEAAFLREKATIANIAHELRTPVAGLRMTLELAMAAKPSATELKTLTTCLRITLSMQAMIANLLTLARLEANPLLPTTDETDLEEITRACWSNLDARASERGLHIRWEMSANVALVRAAPEQIHMIVGNLLDNAVSYCPPTGNITVIIENRDSHVALTVRNPTDGTLKKCTDVFLPFWRGDTSRTGDLHCGLGLALVQRLVSALGGSVEAQLDDQHHFIITVLLPAVTDGPVKPS
jgi:signal transduction histidine kinase